MCRELCRVYKFKESSFIAVALNYLMVQNALRRDSHYYGVFFTTECFRYRNIYSFPSRTVTKTPTVSYQYLYDIRGMMVIYDTMYFFPGEMEISKISRDATTRPYNITVTFQ